MSDEAFREATTEEWAQSIAELVTRAAMKRAIERERRECAAIARAIAEKWDARGDGLNAFPACEEIEAAIRARGDKT